MDSQYQARVQRLYVIVLFLSGIICLLLAAGLVGYGYVVELQDERDRVERQRNVLETQIATTANLSEQDDGKNSRVTGRSGAGGTVATTEFAAPAVGSATGQGKLITGQIVGLRQSELYVSATTLEIGPDSQEAFQIARQVVEQSSYDPQYNGLTVSLSAPGQWDRIDGGSIGLATALGYAALNRTVELNSSVAATGELTDRGQVRPVTSIRAKAQAAAEAGKDLLLVPIGQAISVPQIAVRGVRNLSEAAEYALTENSV